MDRLKVAWSKVEEAENVETFGIDFKQERLATPREDSAYFNFLAEGDSK